MLSSTNLGRLLCMQAIFIQQETSFPNKYTTKNETFFKLNYPHAGAKIILKRTPSACAYALTEYQYFCLLSKLARHFFVGTFWLDNEL